MYTIKKYSYDQAKKLNVISLRTFFDRPFKAIQGNPFVLLFSTKTQLILFELLVDYHDMTKAPPVPFLLKMVSITFPKQI